MGYVHFLSHFMVLAVVWFTLSCLIGYILLERAVVGDTKAAAEVGMIISTVLCLLVLGIAYW